jgi:2-polyprenyl-3-methyl-5-hydroxy-6-metoxy-1,4-benzoquinol methylase/glycosyltransferase involved in cell wall biosynthesis
VAPLRSLYVCYLSLEDPLVSSQVVAYLDGLARRGHTIHLLTFEPQRLTRARRRALRERLRAQGVRWHGLRYHKRPSLPATAFDTVCGALACAWLTRRHKLDAIHARSHVPAAMALLAEPVARHQLIFDIRGLMAEEYVDAGRWRPDGLAFRITKRVQQAAIRRAAAGVVLTERARRLLFGEARRDDVFVIPCCADVERIASARRLRDEARRTLAVGERPVLVYVGKFGGWYMAAEMADFFAVAREVIEGLHFLVLTQTERHELEQIFASKRIDRLDYTITSVEHARLGELLAGADAAIALIEPAPSKIASSPTKIGECLAAGLPVLATDIGDVKPLLARTDTGIVVERFAASAYRAAAVELAGMLGDPGLAERCTTTAREQLSLSEVGVPRYDQLYRFVAGADGCPVCGSPSRRRLRRYAQAGLVRCLACGLIFSSRRPSDRELAAWYAAYPVEERVSPVTAARLQEIAASFDPYRRLGTLLDVGAGSGHLLEAANRAGWSAHAIEYGPRQRERLAALGHRVHPPLLEAGELEDGSFDVVVMQEVLEHVRDPAAELREVARVLRPGGLVYVTCPNFDSFSRRALGPGWTVVEYPEHLNYFTASTLRALMGRHGFQEVSLATTGLSVSGLLARLPARASAGGGGGSVDERIRATAEHSETVGALTRVANYLLGVARLGDTIKGRYERR